MNLKIKQMNGGFTLLELLVAMAIMSIAMGVVVTTFVIQRSAYDVQGQITEMVQMERAAMDLMIREIRMAGYDPAGTGFDGILFDTNQIEIYADINGDGDTDDSNEAITYTYDSDQLRIDRNTGSGNQLLADHIQGFGLSFLDDNGNPTVNTADIRQVRILIRARTEKPDSKYSENNGYRTYTLTSIITPKNLQVN